MYLRLNGGNDILKWIMEYNENMLYFESKKIRCEKYYTRVTNNTQKKLFDPRKIYRKLG